MRGIVMNEKLQIAFGLLGGLAIFIYGMNMMSECLQNLPELLPLQYCRAAVQQR